MNLLGWLSSIVPRFDREKILDDIRTTNKELDTGVLPNYNEASKHFVGKKFKSQVLIDMSKTFYRNADLDVNKGANIILDMNKVLINVKKNLEFVEVRLSKILEKDVLTVGLTNQKALLIRAAEHISFISRFSIDFLTYIYSQETISLLNRDSTEDEMEVYKASPFQIRNVEKNFIAFSQVFGIYAIPEKDFAAKFNSAPDVILNQNNFNIIVGTFELEKVDPILENRMLLGFENNPIYHFRLMIAEWQAERYNCFKDKKKSLELRLLVLKQLEDGQKDPKLENEIEYLENRIEKYEFKMKKMEESVE